MSNPRCLFCGQALSNNIRLYHPLCVSKKMAECAQMVSMWQEELNVLRDIYQASRAELEVALGRANTRIMELEKTVAVRLSNP